MEKVIEILLDSSITSETSSTTETDTDSSGVVQPNKHAKILTFMDIVNEYSSDDFIKHFRLIRSTAYEIIENYTASEVFQRKVSNKGGVTKISAEKEVLVFLWYMANTEPYRTLANLFGISKFCAWKIVGRVTCFIISIGHNYVKWPSNFASSAHVFEQKTGVPGVVGAIDCSDIRIKAPHRNKEDYYTRKKCYAIKLQAVVDANKSFLNIHCGEPGSIHDSRVLRRSKLYMDLYHNDNFFGNGYFIIGDSAYPCLKWLVTPYKDNGNLTPQQRKFNVLHSSTRIAVEHAFGLLKQRFRMLQFFMEHQDIKAIVNLITAGCILHNICIQRNDNISSDILPGLVTSHVSQVEADNINTTRREELFQELVNKHLI